MGKIYTLGYAWREERFFYVAEPKGTIKSKGVTQAKTAAQIIEMFLKVIQPNRPIEIMFSEASSPEEIAEIRSAFISAIESVKKKPKVTFT
jgi:hypothetical protein